MLKDSILCMSLRFRVVFGIALFVLSLGCSEDFTSWVPSGRVFRGNLKGVFTEQKKKYIVLSVSGSLVEQEDFNILLSTIDTSGSSIYTPVRKFVTLLDYAGKDSDIGLVVLDLRQMKRSSLVSVIELYRALQRFKETGKKVYAYGYTYWPTAYVLASLADEIWIDSLGEVALDGFFLTMPFYLRAMQKYGLDAYVFKAGEFKSAVEPFISSQMSSELYQYKQKLVQDMWNGYVSLLLESARFSEDHLRKYVKERPQLLDQYRGNGSVLAVDKKLVNRIGTWDEFNTCLKELSYEKENSESGLSYLSKAVSKNPQRNTRKSLSRIAIVYATGEISPEYVGRRSDIMDTNALIRNLEIASEHPKTKAIVIRVDSPGGRVDSTEQVAQAITKARNKVPVLISGAGRVLSGGYWLSLSANEIWAEERSLVGSIGVFSLMLNAYSLLNEHGISEEMIKTHEQAAINYGGLHSLPPNRVVQKMYQNSTNNTYKHFLRSLVVSKKAKDLNSANDVAQGKVYTGKEALKLGLLDGVGSFHEVLKRAAEIAKLEKYTIVVCNSKRSLISAVVSLLKNPLMFGTSWLWGLLNYMNRESITVSTLPFLDYMSKAILKNEQIYALSDLDVIVL